jgi:hypothetical protein
MKRILFIISIVLALSANAQISVEHVYDSASTYDQNDVFYMELEVSGEQYINVNRMGQSIEIYALNYTLIRSIPFASLFPPTANANITFLYFSEHLFNADDKMEFLSIYLDTGDGVLHTQVFNEDGICLFTADSMAPWVEVHVPQLQYPIFSTSTGTKMILSHQFNGTAKVFSIPGALNAAVEIANKKLWQGGLISNPYPNPAQASTQIDFELPEGVNTGRIVFYDLQGLEVKHFLVDRSVKTLHVSTSDLAAGTYYYQLQTSDQRSEGKKIVIIK